MVNNIQITAQPEYDIQFWNAMRNKKVREDVLAKGRDTSTGTYSMPNVAAGKVMSEIEKNLISERLQQLSVHIRLVIKSLRRTVKIKLSS